MPERRSTHVSVGVKPILVKPAHSGGRDAIRGQHVVHHRQSGRTDRA